MSQGTQSNLKLQKFISNQLNSKNEKALILVTHHVNIAEFMGENVGSGDMVLAKVNSAGKLLSYKVYPSPE
jgi:ABC-type lipoprotein export system ATPase subunit